MHTRVTGRVLRTFGQASGLGTGRIVVVKHVNI